MFDKNHDYPDVLLLINGEFRTAQGSDMLLVINPATGETIGQHAHARRADLDAALEAADAGFKQWRAVPAVERAAALNKAAALLRERADDIARLMTLERGKPLAEARGEKLGAAGTLDWFAEEGKRIYGRVIQPRANNVQQAVSKHAVGPLAAFTPGSFPLNQAMRKISFTGSTAVGKHLAALARAHMKRNTMELGGHAPILIFDDADIENAVKTARVGKFRNAGQVWISPARFLVQEGVYEEFADRFVKATGVVIKVGNGLEEINRIGPLVHDRRSVTVGDKIDDSKSRGAEVRLGGKAAEGPDYLFEPTVLTNLTPDMKIMNEEPFGPVVMFRVTSARESSNQGEIS